MNDQIYSFEEIKGHIERAQHEDLKTSLGELAIAKILLNISQDLKDIKAILPHLH